MVFQIDCFSYIWNKNSYKNRSKVFIFHVICKKDCYWQANISPKNCFKIKLHSALIVKGIISSSFVFNITFVKNIHIYTFYIIMETSIVNKLTFKRLKYTLFISS